MAFQLQSSNQVRYGIGSTLLCNGFARAWRPRSLGTRFPECRLGWADARCQMVYPQTPLLRGGYRGYLVFLLAVSHNAQSDVSATIWPLAFDRYKIDIQDAQNLLRGYVDDRGKSTIWNFIGDFTSYKLRVKALPVWLNYNRS